MDHFSLQNMYKERVFFIHPNSKTKYLINIERRRSKARLIYMGLVVEVIGSRLREWTSLRDRSSWGASDVISSGVFMTLPPLLSVSPSPPTPFHHHHIITSSLGANLRFRVLFKNLCFQSLLGFIIFTQKIQMGKNAIRTISCKLLTSYWTQGR